MQRCVFLIIFELNQLFWRSKQNELEEGYFGLDCFGWWLWWIPMINFMPLFARQSPLIVSMQKYSQEVQQ
jgi:hypothetical protein